MSRSRIVLFVVAMLVSSSLFAQSWPPKQVGEETFNKRVTVWYEHGTRESWKCLSADQRDKFAVVLPTTGPAADRPLYVVLHSAGHSVETCLRCTLTVGNHDIYKTPDSFYGLYVDCRANQKTDWWWGGLRANEAITDANRDKAGRADSPVESRVFDTIHWVMETYKIDANRVYLCGNSMGGSGTLGLGLPHGELFAAIKANVPAGIRHAGTRLAFPEFHPDGPARVPDPPICIDYSGTNDKWSSEHEILFANMEKRKYPIIAYWGNYGHANNHAKIKEVNDLIDSFDWTAIRKNALYPVFTGASCDSPIPWPNEAKCETPGQLNAFFRWNNVADESDSCAVELRLVTNDALHSKFFTVPEKATADVTLRRLQKMKIEPGTVVKWTFGDQHGTVVADKPGLATIPKLVITAKPTVLKLTK